MHSGPSKSAEAIVGILVPPACREEILGDLHERFTSGRQYALDALRTVPLVIISRIRRTQDPQVLVIQGFALYLSFLCAAWLTDRALLRDQLGHLRLAIPAVMVMLGLILDDVYANSGRRPAVSLARGPLLGVVLALASQAMSGRNIALPRWTTLYGCAMGLLLSSAVRMFFTPVAGQLQGVNAPAHWQKQGGGSRGNPQGRHGVLKGIFLLVALLTAYYVWKRG
jgi:hypothetical protein